MRHNPIYASTLGDKRFNDQIDDFSQETIDADLEHERLYLSRIEAIDTTGFPDQEILNQRLMVRDLRMDLDLDRSRFKLWEMPPSGVGTDAFVRPALQSCGFNFSTSGSPPPDSSHTSIRALRSPNFCFQNFRNSSVPIDFPV